MSLPESPARAFYVPFRVELAFESGFTVPAFNAEHAEQAAQAALAALRLATEHSAGGYTFLDGELVVTDVQVGDPEAVASEGVALARPEPSTEASEE